MALGSPHLTAFLDGLPDGLESHPSALAKASLCRTLLDGTPPMRIDDLPGPLRAVAEVPVSAWVPEVYLHGLVHAIRDTLADHDAFTAYCYSRWYALFDGPLYRIMLAAARPSLLVRASALRWRTFHRGSEFVVSEVTASSAVATIRHPPGLWGEVFAVAQVEGLRAILDLSGARAARFAFETGDEALRIMARWES